MRSYESANRLTSLSNKNPELLFCADYWTGKIYAKLGALRGRNLTDFSFDSDEVEPTVIRALRNEINTDIKSLNRMRDTDSDSSADFETNGWVYSQVEIPNSCMGAYRELKRKLRKPYSNTPASVTKAFERLEKKAKTKGILSKRFKDNLQVIAESFNLTDIETRIVAFLIVVKAITALRDALNSFNYTTKGITLMAEVIAAVLDLPVYEVSSCLARGGRLSRTGVFELDHHDSYSSDDFEDFYTVLDGISPAEVIWGRITVNTLIKDFLKKTAEAKNILEDFDYLPEIKNTIIPFLRDCNCDRQKGVNILLFGPPGTGKTELAKIICKEAGLEQFELLPRSEKRENRLNLWQTAATALRNNKSAVLTIDEADDLFNESLSLSEKRSNKACINEALESTPCPTIWMTNSIQSMDPSMIRRFYFVVKVDNPPKKRMKVITEKYLGKYLSEENIARVVNTSKLSPGIVSQVSEIAKSLTEYSQGISQDRLMKLIEEILQAQGFGSLAKKESGSSALYDPKLTNATVNLDNLVAGLEKAGSGRLCLYGPPGTGKTAFAKYVAEQLGKPLIMKKASDLLNCFVGGTERLIAEAFEEAARDKAVLLIDEADSFIQDRKGATHSWEITQVNEFLTQMENFDGIFIATTNHLDLVDSASIRRFDLKANFDYLAADQSKELFRKFADKWQFDPEPFADKVERLSGLTPGDFAAVDRHMRFSLEVNGEVFYSALEDECRVKLQEEFKKPQIGFS